MKILCDLPDKIVTPDGVELKYRTSFYFPPNIPKGVRYRKVGVLSRNLRNKTDLYHRPYKETTWIFSNVPLL